MFLLPSNTRAPYHAVVLTLQLAAVLAAPPNIDASLTAPSVTLDHGHFIGTTDGTSNRFLGIPYAKPPTGELRLRLPVLNNPYTGSHPSTDFGPSCPQKSTNLTIPPGPGLDALIAITAALGGSITSEDEDCLTLNVWTPAKRNAGAKLPVAVWLHGGGFQTGGSSTYNGAVIVNRSVALEEPIIYVSINYRLSGCFGFLASKQVKDAGLGNLGLHDQRLALQWVQKYIHAFGGDPTKVTLFGESAGAVSASIHMITSNEHPPLFRAAFMESGAPVPVGDIEHAQPWYDDIVEHAGCAGARDTLQCLRETPFEKLKAAMDRSPGTLSYQSLNLAWTPRVDGVFLRDTPENLVVKGDFARIPFVNGNCDDEGTLFALPSLNVTNEEQLRGYLKEYFLPSVSPTELDRVLALYSGDVTQGSPYDTGTQNALTPEFKRISSLLGDMFFQGPRRFLLEHRAGKQKSWSYLSKRMKTLPTLGSGHTTELFNIYGPGDLTDYFVRFVNHLDPNGPDDLFWPQYDARTARLLTLVDGVRTQLVREDTYRKEGMGLLVRLLREHPL
ncbi:carotenoid ester lipase precursor [Cristinia sonorae]|uniref:Carboxylic ester hydrolase n=1 Tax=Cristinia sonorae TaxID=1940300 RepID=A0A8K0UDY6_9AGAR|nr:carotenoid ester lipase precursor [Cristinia sonorae]